MQRKLEFRQNQILQPCASTKIKAEIAQIRFHNEDNGWTVLKCKNLDDHCEFNGVGYFINIFPKEVFFFFGKWIYHKQFGKQFQIERAVEARPSTKQAICRYLSSGIYKGIGPKTASRIVEQFGHETIDILDNNPEKLRQVPKLGKKAIGNIIRAWKEKRNLANTMMLLSQHGIAGALARKIVKIYQQKELTISEIITQNPYQLIRDVAGIGFLTADKIALSVGITADDPRRLQEAIMFILEQASERGHCYLTTHQLISKLSQLLTLEQEKIITHLESSLTTLNEDLRVITCSHWGSVNHYAADLLYAERQSAFYLLRLINTPFAGRDPHADDIQLRINNWLDRYSEQTNTKLSESQLNAVKTAAVSKIFILTGGPGVGKTTTANAIIQLLRAMGRSVSLCAPTGRAAQRMSELSQMPAKTIHRLLEWSPVERRFMRDEHNTIATQAIIIDEASMLDIRLAECLFKAIPSTAQLIIIGDVDQLPAVGAGNVLRDLINANVIPTCQLTEVFRQAACSKITSFAHLINQGQMPQFDNESANDCHFLHYDSTESILTGLKNLLTISIPNAGYNLAQDVQILTPMNRGDLGSQNLNEMIQELVNPPTPTVSSLKHHGLTFRLHDKVIQTINNYDLGVFNGDIGFICDINSEKKELSVDFSGKQILYKEDSLDDLSLAYAITIHKSQGSEFPVAIIPIAMNHFVMLQRNLVYTALTRAKKLAVFIGNLKALHLAIRNETSAERQTHLKNRLQDAFNNKESIYEA